MAGFEDFEITDDAVDFTKFAVQPEDRKRFVRAYDVFEEICELSFGKLAGTGLTLPWAKWQDYVRFPRGQVTLWGGFTHHGKTQVLKQQMAWAMRCNEPVMIASLEERVAKTLFDLCCIVMNMRNPDRDAIDVFCNWAKERLWIYNQKRLVSPERMIGVANYAAKELGAVHVMADSLMRLDLNLEDLEATKVFGNMLGLHADQHNYHMHLVAHVRKGDETKPPNLYDIKGASYLIDQVDRIITVWRNKVPKAKREPNKHYKWDAVLTVDKQRGRPDWIGQIGLDYHYDSTQLVLADSARPVEYIPGFGPMHQSLEMFGT